MNANRPEPEHRLTWGGLNALLGERKVLLVGLVVASLVAAFAETAVLAITAQVATDLVDGSRGSQHSLGPLTLHVTVGGLLEIALGLAIVRLLLQGITSYVPAVISGDVQQSLRRRLAVAYMRATWSVQSQDKEGHFQELMGQQIQMASYGSIGATNLVVLTVTLAIMVASAFTLNVVAALLAISTASVLFVLLRPLNRASGRAAKVQGDTLMDLAAVVGETSRVSEEAQVFGVRDAQRLKVESFVESARSAMVRAQAIGRLGPAVYQSLIYIGLVAGLIVLHSTHVANLASLGAVVLLMVRSGSYGAQAQGAYQNVVQAAPFVERLAAVTQGFAQNQSRHEDAELDGVHELAFVDVGYAYHEERPILTGIDFKVRGGETVGIIGPTGTGKSTVVQVLLRLRDPVSGEYRVNGQPATLFSDESWSRQVSYLPQQPKLLHASVSENVRFYRDLSEEEVERACREAHIHDEIMSWPGGYDTIVGPRADAVSGGQQQRICLARAIVTQPSLLVLDEPTSQLDPRSEVLIQESLVQLRKHTTLFVVAHRMSTLTICDRVMVILDGRVDAFTSLSELSLRNDYYRNASLLGGTDGHDAT